MYGILRVYRGLGFPKMRGPFKGAFIGDIYGLTGLRGFPKLGMPFWGSPE